MGRVKRLHYAIDDLVDWWDMDIKKEELEYMLKNEIYTKAVFKNILEFSNIKKNLDNLEMKPKIVNFSKVYYINLLELNSEEKILKSLSYNQRRNIKKYQNRLNKIKYEFLEAKSYKPYFDNLISFIREKYKNSLFNDDLYCKILYNALDYFENSSMLNTFILKTKEDIMSINIVINYEKRSFWWLTGFNEKYSYYSPTRMSIYYMLKHYLSKNFVEFNFMKGESEYKTLWTNNFYKLYRYEFENPNLIKKVFSFFSFF